MVEEAIAAYEALPLSAGMVRALLGKHTLLMNDGRYAEALAVAHAATQAAQEVGHARLHREALNWVAWHQGVGGSPERAAETMARAASLVPSDTDPIGDIIQAMLLTDMLLLTGRSADAIDAAGKPGDSVAERWQIDKPQVLLVRSNMTWGRIRRGRGGTGSRACRRTDRRSDRRQSMVTSPRSRSAGLPTRSRRARSTPDRRLTGGARKPYGRRGTRLHNTHWPPSSCGAAHLAKPGRGSCLPSTPSWTGRPGRSVPRRTTAGRTSRRGDGRNLGRC